MKLIILAALVSACAAAVLPGYVAPVVPPQYARTYYPERARAALERNAAVLRSVSDQNELGYHWAYDTENGIQAEETGREANGIQAAGGYSYTGDDGQVYSVRYTADVNGFQAQGAHLPTPPPIPEAIAKALAENARDEAAGIFDDGSYRDGKYDSGVFAARQYTTPRHIDIIYFQISSFAAIIAAASAGQIFSQPQAEHYAQAADAYQSNAELEVPSAFDGQSQGYSGHEGGGLAYQGRQSKDAYAQILAYHSENDGHNYQYAYETENGIKAQEVGTVNKGTQAEGGYSYTGDDGHVYTVNYIADEHGFRASGAHLPTPPPIPEAILKALEQNARDEAAGILDDGSYHDQHQQGQNYQLNGYQQEAYHAAPAQAVSSEAGYHH
ncbi:uncharacterized protein LOC123875827 [Maniola jurtina]|uniref:uncharacterized protein LOC123875827 n=1 Tax=Maniola jurtina TaxID=191418 RepID=UPI001E6892EB|nr:uncharacterized protein LOC123875827 [Maniola jurtina]